jgi:hypothetical protein
MRKRTDKRTLCPLPPLPLPPPKGRAGYHSLFTTAVDPGALIEELAAAADGLTHGLIGGWAAAAAAAFCARGWGWRTAPGRLHAFRAGGALIHPSIPLHQPSEANRPLPLKHPPFQ